VFVALHLTGIAFKWYQALEGDPFSRSFAAFRHELLTAFNDGDLGSRSVAALQKLEQTGSVAEYTTNFEVHSVHTEYKDVALCDAFYFSLKDKLKDLITKAGRPSTLAKLKGNALKFDHHVMDRQREQPAHAVSPPAKALLLWMWMLSLLALQRKVPLALSPPRKRSVKNMTAFVVIVLLPPALEESPLTLAFAPSSSQRKRLISREKPVAE
jgi:hypothetical protein